MILTPRQNGGVYVEFRDRHRRKKSECVTVAELTPKQAARLFERAVREELARRRKAS